MSKLKTRSQQLELVNGTRRERGDFASVTDFTSALPIVHDKGSLYVVAEAVGEKSRGSDVGRLVMRVIKQEYYADTTDSIPVILGEAIKTANRVLFQENLKVDDESKVKIGVSCAAIHEQTVYLAQVQPAQAFFSRQGSLYRVPDYLDSDEESRGHRTELLGAQHVIQPSIITVPFGPGDSLCLCSTNLARRIVAPEDEYGLVYCDAKTAIDHLFRLAQRERISEAHALIVEAVPLKEGERVLSPREGEPRVAIPGWQAKRTVPSEPIITSDRRAAASVSSSTSLPRPSASSSSRGLPGSPLRSSTTSASPGAAAPDSPTFRSAPRHRILEAPDFQRPAERPRRMEVKELTVDDPFLTPPWLKIGKRSETFRRAEEEPPQRKGVSPDEKLFWIQVPDERSQKARRQKAQRKEEVVEKRPASPRNKPTDRSGGLSNLAFAAVGGVAAAVGRVAGRRTSIPRKERSVPSESMLNRRWLVFGLIAVVLAVAVFFSFRILETRQKWSNFDALIQRAEDKRQAALQEGDHSKARTALIEARGLVGESRKLGLDEVRVESLDRSLQADLDKVDGVVRLQSLASLLDVREIVGPKSELHQVVFAADFLFLLDKYSSSIYRFDQKQSSLAVLLGKGWLVDDKPVADILLLAESGGSIIAVDSDGFVFTLDPNAMAWHRFALGGDGKVD
ncbi:MAG: hypothetical protein M1358_20480, partial [Chloroflexi bacterium]|nr:hypothetical protein [Chloroflexota bacterium]